MRMRVAVGYGYDKLHEAGELWVTTGEFWNISQGQFMPEYEEDVDEQAAREGFPGDE
jgi:hypothetical protein